MDPRFRVPFNAAFREERHARYVANLTARVGGSILFRLAETPVFLTAEFIERCERAAMEIVGQLSDPARQRLLERAVPDRWRAPGVRGLPNFAILDFAVAVGPDGSYVPRLIELQGFPSLMAFTLLQRDAWAESLSNLDGLREDWSCWFGGLDRDSFLSLARRTVLGDRDPRSVILMDIEPEGQKTNADFAATKSLWDVDAVSLTRLIKRGRRLFRRAGDGEIPVERIYNRVVFDELERKQLTLPFDYRDELDVEWASHPNWFWMWSKYALPLLDHPCVPLARYLSDYERLPRDLSIRYVLKPLFSFSGAGVTLAPTAERIAQIPHAERDRWLVQERVEYGPVVQAVDGGGVKVELRVIMLRPDDAPQLVAAENLCRLTRGEMLGVDYNKDATWVGSSVGIVPAPSARVD